MPGPDGRFLKGEHWREPRLHWDVEWLRRQYIECGRSANDIAAEIGVTGGAIIYWLNKHGVRRRSISEARSVKHWGASGSDNPMHGKTGALNPRYVDGSSPERQRMYARGEGKEFIRRILKRDQYACRRCGATKRSPKSLHVHHIRAWAGHPDLRFDDANVVTVCRNCHSFIHSKANSASEFLA